MERADSEKRVDRHDEGAAIRPSPTWRLARVLIAIIPALALLATAFLIDVRQRDLKRQDYLAAAARHAAEAVDQRLDKLLDLIAFCTSSPSLVEDVNLEVFAENCGRYSTMQDSWVVLIELGETHRHILNTRAIAGEALPAYPRAEERPMLLALEARSKASGAAEIIEVFEGRIFRSGVVTAGQYVRLGDGRPAMLYVSTDVVAVSRLLELLAGPGDSVFALVDSSHRIVARSTDIERYLFADAPDWLRDIRETEQFGARLGVPGPSEIGGLWDAGYHPLSVAPGWMVAAVEPRQQRLWPPPMSVLPIGTALLGLLLSGLSLWGIGYRDRVAARIAEAERARTEAERSNREKSRLLASLAHDIRTPLISLLGSLDFTADGGSCAMPGTLTAKRSAEALLQLVDDILELSYLGSDRMTLKPSPVDLQRLAGDLIDRFQEDANRKGLALHVDLAQPSIPIVSVDRLRLDQVLGNLLSNAIKYTDTGMVTLRLKTDEVRADTLDVTFSVMDTGAGIAPEDVAEVLREFGRLERAVSAGESGTGLGLAICQRILKTMGSELTLQSTPGEGSVFSFTLRLPTVVGEVSRVEVRPLEGVSILYAEDEAVIRKVTARRLAAAGARVVEARNGTEALDKLADFSPDLVLLDLQMPKLDGVGTIRRLRAMDPPICCPVFVLTSHIASPQAAAARAAGADEVFTKPVQILPLAVAMRTRGSAQSNQTSSIEAGEAPADERLVDAIAFGAVATATINDLGTGFIARFGDTLRTNLAQLAVHVAEGRAGAASEIAHQSRGLCQVLGARRLAAQLLYFETALADEGSRAIDGRIAEMQATLDATLAAMMEIPTQVRHFSQIPEPVQGSIVN